MKIFFCIWLSLFLVLKVMSEEEICNAMNDNNEVSQAFRWNDWLFFVLKNGAAFRIEFKWDSPQLFVGKPLPLPWWKTNQFKLIFPADYPEEGRLIVGVNWDYSDKLKNWSMHLIHLKNSGSVEKSDPISLNVRKCSATVGKDPLSLCALFAHFNDEQLENKLQTILSFPTPIGGLPSRFFAYYKKPVSNETYQTIRQIYVSRNSSTGKGQYLLNWVIDSSTKALNDGPPGFFIDTSTALTDYIENGDKFLFDFIELFGTQFSIYRAMIDKKQVFEELRLLKNGSIAWIFGCKQNEREIFALTSGPPQDQTVTESLSPETKESMAEPIVTKKRDKEIEPSANIANESKGSGGMPLLLILVIVVIIIVIFFIIICFIVCRKRGEPLNKKEEPPSEKKPPSPSVSASLSEKKAEPKPEIQHGPITLKTPSEMSLEGLTDPGSKDSTGSTLTTAPSVRSDIIP